VNIFKSDVARLDVVVVAVVAAAAKIQTLRSTFQGCKCHISTDMCVGSVAFVEQLMVYVPTGNIQYAFV